MRERIGQIMVKFAQNGARNRAREGVIRPRVSGMKRRQALQKMKTFCFVPPGMLVQCSKYDKVEDIFDNFLSTLAAQHK